MRMYKTKGYHFDSERVAGCYNDSKVLICFNQRFILDCGGDDCVTAYHDKEKVYVISENSSLDYVGLQVFDRKNGEELFNIFFDSRSMDDTQWLLDCSRYPTKINFMLQWYN